MTQSTPSIRIRRAHEADADTVYKLISDLEGTMLDHTQFRAVFRQNLANAAIHYLVAEWTDVVVGFISCHVQHLLHHTGKVGEIQELYVKPDYRNQHIGHQLMAALNAVAIQEGFVNLEVTTNRKRIDTLRFYEQEHFSCTHFKLVKSFQT